MTVQIPNLWPDDVRVDILSPLAILRTQASRLNEITKGVLEAQIEEFPEGDSGFVSQFLYLVAPALDYYRHLVIRIHYRPQLVYPVTIVAECFQPGGSAHTESCMAADKDWAVMARSEQEFLKYLRTILHSPEVTSVVHSLIARSNDLTNGIRPGTAEGIETSAGNEIKPD